jgi:hypothetical protein
MDPALRGQALGASIPDVPLVAGGASVIVTRNVRDFRGAELHFPGLRILLPEDLLKEM